MHEQELRRLVTDVKDGRLSRRAFVRQSNRDGSSYAGTAAGYDGCFSPDFHRLNLQRLA